MLPQPQLVPIVFEGLDTFTDPRRGIPAKLDLLENGYISTPLKIQKRPGFSSQTRNINGGGTLSAGTKLARLKDELVMSDGSYLYSKSAATANWLKRSKMPSGTVYQDKITSEAISSVRLNTTGAYLSGVTLYAWQGRSVNTTTWRTVDATTGATLASGTFNGTVPKALACGSFLFLSTLDSSNGRIEVRRVDPTSPTSIGAPTTVDTSAGMTHYDVTVDTGNTKLLYAYFTTNTLDVINLRSVTTVLAVSANVPFNNGSGSSKSVEALSWLYHDYSNGSAYLGVSWTVSNGAEVFDITTSTLAKTAQTTGSSATAVFNSLTGYYSGGNRVLIGETPGATSDLTILNIWSNGGGAIELMRSVVLTGKIFKQGSRYYLPVSYEDTTQRSRFLLEYEDGTLGANGGTAIVGFLGAGDDGGLSGGFSAMTAAQSICDPINFGSGAWGLPWHYSFSLGSTYGVQQHRVTFSEAGLSAPERFADALFIPGLQLNVYDGIAVTEQGFYLKPGTPTLADSGSTGTKTSGGSYNVRLIYRWTANGRMWRSPAGPSANWVLGPGKTSISVTAPTLRITGKAAKFNSVSAVSEVAIEAYSTINGGSTYYFDGAGTNSVTANTVTFVISNGDAALQANELLYQQSGVLENSAIPAVRLVKTYGTRLMACVSHGDVWFTKSLAEGDGAHFSAVFRIPLDTSDGDITALMDMDQSFLMGQRNGVYLLGGGDPTDTGQNLFGQPTRINTTNGPVDQVSVARLPTGLAYNSPRGIYVMSRGLDAQFVGDKVQRYTLADTISGAVVLDGRNHVAWTTSTGDILVYDYVLSQWYVWTGLAAVACTLYQNILTILASDGTVKVETAGTFVDDNKNISMAIRTSWIGLGGIAGYQRLWDVLAIGEYKGAHQLQMLFSYDGSSFVNETLTANPSTVTYNTTIEGNYAWEAQPKQQLCRSVQITITDLASGGSTTEAFYLTGIALNLGVIGGPVRLPSGRALT